MRILELQLKAFGPFTDKNLDLSANGLQIIYGLNGAGKSCSLRALQGLLFGIDPKSNDDFIHNSKKLRIGGRLQHADGTTIEILRRKGNKNTLMGPDENPVADDLLDRFLAGVTSEAFGMMFGIDHDGLIRGADILLKGGGELGNSLFAAALGGADPNALLRELDAQAEALFKPRGQNQAINKAVSEYNEARRRVSEYSVLTLNWSVQDRTLSKARVDREGLQRQIDELVLGRKGLERLQRLWPPVSKRRARLAQLELLKHVVVLPPDFSDIRKAALAALGSARAAKEEAEVELEQLSLEKAAIHVPKAILESSEAINALNQRFGSHRKANQDLAKLHGNRQQLEADTDALLKELPADVQDHAKQQRIPVDRRTRLQALGTKEEALRSALLHANKNLAKATKQLASAREEYGALPPESGGEILRGALDRALKLGDIVQSHRKVLAAVRLEEEQSVLELKRLSLWDRSLEVLEQLAVPSRESLDRFESILQNQNAKSERIREQIRKSETELAEIESQLEELKLSGQVPIEDDLRSARERREQGWQLIRRAWLEGQDVTVEAKEYGNGSELPVAFEEKVTLADEIADRLRREADRVAGRAALLARRNRNLEVLTQLSAEQQNLTQDSAKDRSNWISLWTPTEIEPQSPREMRTWLDQRDRLVQRADRLRTLRHDAEGLQEQIVKYSAELTDALRTTALVEANSNEDFNTLLDRARSVVYAQDQAEARRREVHKSIGRFDGELETARLEQKQVEAETDEWNRSWMELLQSIGFPQMGGVEAIALMMKLEELFSKTSELKSTRQRIESIERDAAQFEKDVRTVAENVAPESLTLPLDRIVAHLVSRLTKAQTDRVELDGLEKRIQDKDTLVRRSAKTIEDATRQLATLCSQAGCADQQQLLAAEERSTEVLDVRKEIKALEETIREMGHAVDIEPIIQEVLSIDPDSLPPRIAELNTKISELEEARTAVDQTIGAAKIELSKIDGTSTAAVEAERAQSIMAGARESVERYMRLRLASAILRREIENYRVRNQGPLLTRAQELFSALTLQTFTSLTTEYDEEEDLPKLKAIRANGEIVATDGLSDGTRDQLYLALRLASLEQYLQVNEPMPFIVDDILIRFDDDRAAATLNVIAELSKKTQVLFFTHHGRLVDLAKSVKTVPVSVYYLDSASGIRTATTGSA